MHSFAASALDANMWRINWAKSTSGSRSSDLCEISATVFACDLLAIKASLIRLRTNAIMVSWEDCA